MREVQEQIIGGVTLCGFPMASGPGSRAEEQPPMLPVKLHR